MIDKLPLRQLGLIALSLGVVLYLFGVLRPSWALILMALSIGALYFGVVPLFRQMREADHSLMASEQQYSFAGWQLRVHVAPDGELWLRAADLRRLLEFDKPDTWLHQRYPEHFRKIHEQIDTFFMHPMALHDYLGQSTRDDVQRFLAWLRREVVGLHERRRGRGVLEGATQSEAAEAPATPALPRFWLAAYFVRHWRGELGLFASLLGSGAVVAGAMWVTRLIQAPLNIAEHYQSVAVIYVTGVVVSSVGLYWWGRGVLMSVQRWLAAERSLLIAMLACAGGFCSIFIALTHLVETDKQYFLTDFVTILLDADGKPEITYDPARQRLRLEGDLGFGSSKRLRRLVQQYPQARGLELKSYGGRVAEGFAISNLVEKHNLETFSRAECMSACVIAFAAGRERHVAATARFGLHRSGMPWQQASNKPSFADQVIAYYLLVRGVEDAFVGRGMQPSLHSMWEPSVEEVMQAKLGTATWEPDS